MITNKSRSCIRRSRMTRFRLERIVGCVDGAAAWVDAPIAREVNFDLQQADAGTFTDDDLAAIQDAI
ncbi:hypothetical protein O9929_20590 [Vibrio lentus]|nr:hypothetical protein [Vibrio lentus]